ncbi:MAG TPA: branched-chain amino acid ABC transporter permease [Trueperaceae bacterium]|nr:branched-chain amino acid ABC transporter permease [Trueperaceae bacterium]HRP46623.1 branched-chain amino acid ABC transporter permease [Trueperaceae bacterium]
MNGLDSLVQALVSGASIGSVYALVALGLVLLYRTTRILNFAHGDLGVAGTFIAYTLLTQLRIPFGLSFLLALVAAAAIGMLIYLLLVRPAKNQSELGLLILTLGLALALGGLDALLFGTSNKVVPTLVPDQILRFGGVSLSLVSLITSLFGVVLMVALWALLTFTKLGVAMRAVAQREDVAEAVGLPVRTVLMATWAAAAVLATAAALLFAPTTLLNPTMMLDPLSKGFVAAVIGGMNSLPGAVLGGYLLGILELLVGVYISLEFKASFAFLVVVLVLVLKPHGLLGRADVKRV